MSQFVFSGDTEQCYQHLMSQTFVRNPFPDFAEFVHCEPERIGYRWLRRFSALGDNLMRLRYLLEALDYDVSELRVLDPVVRDLGRLFAYDIATIQDLAVALGYEGGGQTRKVLMGQRNVSEDRKVQAQEFVDSFAGLVNEKRTQLAQLKSLIMEKEPHAAPSPAPARERPATKAPNVKEATIAAFSHGVQALIPLARLLMSDEFSADDRKRMRELAGANGVFDLSNLMTGLCGEKARDRAQEGSV